MSSDQPENMKPGAVLTDEEAERIARASGASKEQVTQIAKGSDSGTDLHDAAAAAARWS